MANTASELALLIAARDAASPTLKQIQSELKKISGNLEDTGRSAQTSGKGFDGLVASVSKLDPSKLLAFGVAGLTIGTAVEMAKGFVAAASDMNESASKAEVVFGTASKSVQSFAEGAAQTMGQSSQQALEMSATFGNLFTTMGMGQQQAADMSMQMVQLASDLASFNNIPIGEALQKLRSGLVGEAEPLRSMGVLLSDATMKAKAMELGIASASGELTEAQKVQARYAIIMEQTKTAQGDFARTSTGLANAQKIVQSAMADSAAKIGQELLPQVAEATSAFGKALPGATDTAILWMKSFMSIGSGVIDTLKGIAGAAAEAADNITHLGGATGWESLPENPELERMFAPLPGNYAKGTRGSRAAVETANRAALEKSAAASDLADSYNRAGAAADMAAAAIARAESAEKSAAASDLADSYNRVRTAAGLTAEVENIAEAQKRAESEAKKFGSAATSAYESAERQARDLSRTMDDEVGASAIRVSDLWQEHGDRWIEKWGEVDGAIKAAQRSAEDALRAMNDQEMLDASIDSRRRALNERLAGEDQLHRQQAEDQELVYQRERELSRAKDAEDRQSAWDRYNQAVEDTAHRRELAAREAEWRKYLDGERAKLDRELADEEHNRRVAQIERERDNAIAKINADWDAWQKAEEDKTRKAEAEERKRSSARLESFVNDFVNKLADSSAPGVERFASMVQAKLGGALADVGGEAAKEIVTIGSYTGPAEGSAYDAAVRQATWIAQSDEGKAWAQEHGIPSFDGGGIVPGPQGAPKLILAHGGEQILTPTQQRGGNTYQFYLSGTYIGNDRQMLRDLAQELKPYLDDVRN